MKRITLSLLLGWVLALGVTPARAAAISLPVPIYLENFNAVPEGSLPAGWTQTNYSTLPETIFDLQDLASASYAGWVVVDRSRFTSNFLAYSSHTPTDYSRVLSFNADNVVNGQVVTNLAEGRFLMANSGYREGSQVQYLWSGDFDLTGKTNIHLSYHSLWEQNQDNFGAVEYSVDGGANWLPIVYMLDTPDVITSGGVVDAIRTLTNRYPDVATYVDPGSGAVQGGYYGAFIAAPISQALAPFISARINDDPVESKRVELFRLPAADNQATVRFRFAHAGTDSWYFGIDDFGLYSITPTAPVISAAPKSVNVSAGAFATFEVAASGEPPLTFQWRLNGTNIPGATNATLPVTAAAGPSAGAYTVVVSNGAGAVESPGAILTVYVPAVTGQWDFDAGDLRATAGSDVESRDGTLRPAAFTELTLGGQPAQVLHFGSNVVDHGLLMRHGARPNAGGRLVNQYTLLMDVMYPSESSGHWRALWQTDPFNHSGNEADFLVGAAAALPDPNGIGANHQFHASLEPNRWYRVGLAVDLAAPPAQRLTTYLDGLKVATQELEEGVDGRYALGPTGVLFAGGDGSSPAGFVNSIQFVNGWWPDTAFAALGGPVASGLPPGDAVVRVSSLEQATGSLTLRWSGGGGLFRIQKASSLALSDWQDAGMPTSNRIFTVSLDGGGAFYRVKSVPPPLRVGLQPGGESALPTAQLIRTIGDSLPFSGRPVDLAAGPGGQRLYVKRNDGVVVIDAKAWKLVQQLGFPGSGASMHGITVTRDGTRLYVTGAGQELYEATIGATNGALVWSRTVGMPGSSYPCGVAVSSDRTRAYVCLSRLNTLAVVNLPTGAVLRQINVGIAPFDVVLSPDETVAYVSDWGGRRPAPGETTADSAGTQVVVDGRGIGASGAVSIVDLVQNVQTALVPTGLHPADLELSPDGGTLYVANANSDTITVIETATATVRETILVRPDATLPFGSAANALALTTDAKTLVVANAGNNAVALIELPNAQHATSVVQGFIPTDWYPGAVVVDRDYIYVANVKGLGTRNGAPNTTAWDANRALGTVNRIPFPGAELLSKYTAWVHEDGRVPEMLRALERVNSPAPPVPVPARPGEPSVFQHVVYVIKENKTYDQVLGDLPQGNGASNLCVFPRFVTPNHHALAERYVLLDNFYCNGVNSADGHSWSTEGNVTDHLEKAFGGFSRSYTFGDDALTYSSSGFIWDNVLSHGLSFRNYGEMDYASPIPASASWLTIYRDFTNRTGQIRYAQNIGIAPLRPYSSTNVPGWNLGIPDVVRAAAFIKELKAAESDGFWASFHILYLPNDHTIGTSPGYPTPRAQVADNDLALGQAVAAITQSRFGSNTCIFVIEDDPQSGYDHVDGHRSLCLVISPYTKRGSVISEFYNQTAVLHTMERILGLPPMNQLDALAPLMAECFTSVANFEPYTALTNNVRLDEMNGGSASLSRKEQYWVKQSLKLNFSLPDRANEDVLNRIVWHSVKGVDAKYPARWAGAHGKGLKKLGLVLTGERDADD